MSLRCNILVWHVYLKTYKGEWEFLSTFLLTKENSTRGSLNGPTVSWTMCSSEMELNWKAKKYLNGKYKRNEMEGERRRWKMDFQEKERERKTWVFSWMLCHHQISVQSVTHPVNCKCKWKKERKKEFFFINFSLFPPVFCKVCSGVRFVFTQLWPSKSVTRIREGRVMRMREKSLWVDWFECVSVDFESWRIGNWKWEGEGEGSEWFFATWLPSLCNWRRVFGLVVLYSSKVVQS